MCKFNDPDCLNCPYPDCTATVMDIKRQWMRSKKYKVRDNADNVPKKVGTHVKAIYIGTSYTEGVKRRQERYRKTEKGKENERRKMQRAIQNGKNAERCRRYRERKKAAKTTQKLCKSCKYHTEIRFQDVEVACEYIVHTNKSRGDIIGWCDKYEKGKRKRNECKINMKNNMAFSVRKTYEV